MPDAEARVVDLSPHLLSGRLADLTPGSYRVILGKRLAEELGVKVGDRVVLIVALGDVTPLGVLPRMRAFEVAGILSVGMYEYDRRIAVIAMQDAAKLLRMGDDVTGIRLNLADMYAAPRISRAAAVAIGGGVEIQDWTNEHVNFFRSIAITKRILFVMLSLMVAVAAFNIVSTMVMVVKDKRRDIAILRTFGSSPRSILSVFVVQGSLIGLLGILVGVAARRADRGESAGARARAGRRRRLQISGRARVLHERLAGARARYRTCCASADSRSFWRAFPPCIRRCAPRGLLPAESLRND